MAEIVAMTTCSRIIDNKVIRSQAYFLVGGIIFAWSQHVMSYISAQKRRREASHRLGSSHRWYHFLYFLSPKMEDDTKQGIIKAWCNVKAQSHRERDEKSWG